MSKPAQDELQRMYDELGELFLQRGLQRGLGRALTAEEAIEDPVISTFIELLIDGMLGVERNPS